MLDTSHSFPDTGSSLLVASREQSPGELFDSYNAECPAPPPMPSMAGAEVAGFGGTFSLNTFISFGSLSTDQRRSICISDPSSRRLSQPRPLHHHLQAAPWANSAQQHSARKGQAAMQGGAYKGKSKLPSFGACRQSKNTLDVLCLGFLWLGKVVGAPDITHLCCPSSSPTAKQQSFKRALQHSFSLT